MADLHRASPASHQGHETRDINLRAVALFGGTLVLLLVGSLALMAWMFDLFEVTPEGRGLTGAPLADAPLRPPGPQLQTSPARDMQEMRHNESEHLHSYAWVDRDGGLARIPIDRAMELVLQQGLPTWQELPATRPAERAPTPQKESP